MASTSTVSNTEHSRAPAPKIHLAFLDGMRGLAALFVVIHHSLMEYVANFGYDGLRPWVFRCLHWLGNGEVAVNVFIALSGYCLMIPIARSGGIFRGGLGEFVRRRAWRILPTYYTSLAICLFADAIIPQLHTNKDLRWAVTLPVTKGSVLSHLVLLHPLKLSWAIGIDYPAWSIPTEWWLYGIFAILLVPLWRRTNPLTVAALTVIAGIVLNVLVGQYLVLLKVSYLTLFGLGMSAAAVDFSSRERDHLLVKALPIKRRLQILAIVTIIAFVAFCLVQRHTDPSRWPNSVKMLFLAGIASVGLMSWGTLHKQQGTNSPVLRVLESKIAVWLGKISYSLYLIHALVLTLFHLALSHTSLGRTTQVCMTMTVGVAFSVIIGWALWSTVERYSLKRMELTRR